MALYWRSVPKKNRFREGWLLRSRKKIILGAFPIVNILLGRVIPLTAKRRLFYHNVRQMKRVIDGIAFISNEYE